jgi:two-component system NtrC family sensor kinase
LSKTTELKASRSNLGETKMPRWNYRRLLVYSILSVMVVSVVPLSIMTWINYTQYEQVFRAEQLRPIGRLASNTKRSLEFFLSERLSALSLIVREKSLGDLRDSSKLQFLLNNMKRSFGGFVDLGLIDKNGIQLSYAGPYELQGKNYKEQDWFHEVSERGVFVSDVFMGYRKLPHFVIAVLHETNDGSSYVLRATIETEMIERQILGLEPRPSSDAFLINHLGVLQTQSRHFGDVLDHLPLPTPSFSPQAEVMETTDDKGKHIVIGYAYIESSPFIFMMVSKPEIMQSSWLSLRRELVIILLISVVLILSVVISGSTYMVRRVRDADVKRTAVFHKMEYTNRMAVIGRLAAGVAHEINNPLSIISEKSGLLKDLFLLIDKPPDQRKILGLVDSVLKSVDRCSAITHRLLGFAKHMEVSSEKLDLELLLKEVLGFLEKEAHYRDLQITYHIPDNLPHIESDRGQLQQVFLNIINNAFAAVEDKGKIDISAEFLESGQVVVSIADNGIGIPKENLQHVFDPFFSTKAGHGTGLGLSITYGIVEKLGGKISVTSEVGEGTCFTVTLPCQPTGSNIGVSDESFKSTSR